MQTAGDLLKNARLKKKLTFSKISQTTKIPKKTLEALEKNQFAKLPSQTYITGFIRNYCQAVGLDPQKTIAVFRRDYNRQLKNKIVPKGLAKPLNSSWQPSSSTRTWLSIGLVIVLFLAYLGFSLFRLSSPPKLTLSQPDNALTTTSPVLIKGQTDRDATLTLNGKTINLEPDGRFTTVFNGPAGTHEIKLISTSRRNKSVELTRHIIIVEDFN